MVEAEGVLISMGVNPSRITKGAGFLDGPPSEAHR